MSTLEDKGIDYYITRLEEIGSLSISFDRNSDTIYIFREFGIWWSKTYVKIANTSVLAGLRIPMSLDTIKRLLEYVHNNHDYNIGEVQLDNVFSRIDLFIKQLK